MELKNSLLPVPRILVQVAHIELLFGIILNYQVQYLKSHNFVNWRLFYIFANQIWSNYEDFRDFLHLLVI